MGEKITMEMQSLYQVCIYFTIGLMVFTIAVNVMTGMDIFGNIEPTIGAEGNDTDSYFHGFTGRDIPWFWATVIGIEVLVLIPLAYFTQSTSAIGVYIFGAVFWTSYAHALTVITNSGYVPLFILPLFTVPLAFIFIGAVIGMFAGV